MSVQSILYFNPLIFLLLIICQQRSDCFPDYRDLSNRNQIENLQSGAKINFLENEIHLPHGISNELTNQIQNTLSFYENRLLKLGQELMNCDESSRQHETCLKIYNQFKENETNLRNALIGLEKRLISPSIVFSSKHPARFFILSNIINQISHALKEYGVLFNFQFSVMKSTTTEPPPEASPTAKTTTKPPPAAPTAATTTDNSPHAAPTAATTTTGTTKTTTATTTNNPSPAASTIATTKTTMTTPTPSNTPSSGKKRR